MEIEKMKKIKKGKIDRAQFEEAAYLLKALAHETRLCAVMQLSQIEELSVSELREGIECEQSLLSHHLTDMRAKGILNCRRDGRNIYYSLKDKRIINMLKCIMQCDHLNNGSELSIISERKRN